jgi:hypothetical protein
MVDPLRKACYIDYAEFLALPLICLADTIRRSVRVLSRPRRHLCRFLLLIRQYTLRSGSSLSEFSIVHIVRSIFLLHGRWNGMRGESGHKPS